MFVYIKSRPLHKIFRTTQKVASRRRTLNIQPNGHNMPGKIEAKDLNIGKGAKRFKVGQQIVCAAVANGSVSFLQ